MKTFALIAALAGTAAFGPAPQENTKFAPERDAAIAAMLAVD